MALHITRTYRTSKRVQLVQYPLSHAAHMCRQKELSLLHGFDQTLDDAQLHVHTDGVIAAICPWDTVIIQYPGGVSARYNSFLIEHLRRYQGVRIALLVQQTAAVPDFGGYTDQQELSLLNRADLLIMPSEEMLCYYRNKGLRGDIPVKFFPIMDFPVEYSFTDKLNRELTVISSLRSESIREDKNDGKIFDAGDAVFLTKRLRKSGFIFLDTFEEAGPSCEEAAALGMCMAAGVTVIVKKGTPLEKYVTVQGIGFAANGIGEAKHICSAVSDAELKDCEENKKRLRPLFAEGMYSKKLMDEMEIALREMAVC